MDNIGLSRNIHLLAETLVDDKLSVRKYRYIPPFVEVMHDCILIYKICNVKTFSITFFLHEKLSNI